MRMRLPYLPVFQRTWPDTDRVTIAGAGWYSWYFTLNRMTSDRFMVLPDMSGSVRGFRVVIRRSACE